MGDEGGGWETPHEHLQRVLQPRNGPAVSSQGASSLPLQRCGTEARRAKDTALVGGRGGGRCLHSRCSTLCPTAPGVPVQHEGVKLSQAPAGESRWGTSRLPLAAPSLPLCLALPRWSTPGEAPGSMAQAVSRSHPCPLSQGHRSTPDGEGHPGLPLPRGRPPSPRAPRPSYTNVWVAVRRETPGLPRAAQVSKWLCDLITDGNTRTLEACPGGHTRCSWKQHDCTTHGQGGCGQGQSGHCWPQAQQIEGNCQWEGAGDSPPRGQEPLPAGDKRATTTGSGHLSEVPPAIPLPP